MSAVSVATYLDALPGSFVSDDRALIPLNSALRASTGPWAWFFRDYYWGTIISNHTAYRPLTIVSFLVTWRLAGAWPPAFLVGNIALHALASLLVWALGRRLVGERSALWGALLFAVHPLHTEAVAWIAGRAELLAAVGALGVCLLALHATARDERYPTPFAVGAGVAYLAALFSKEHVATLPLWVGAAWVFEPTRRSLARTVVVCAAMAGGLALYLGLRATAVTTWAASDPTLSLFNPAATVPAMHRWLTGASVVWRYLVLFAWPDNLSVDYSFAQIPASVRLGLREAAGLGAIMACVVGIGLGVRRAPGPALALMLVPTTFLIVSNFPFAISTIMAERVTYLPTVGLCLVIGWGLSRLEELSASRGRRWLVLTMIVGVIGVLGLRSAVRNLDWQDSYTLYASAARVSPRSANVHAALADLELKRGHALAAREHGEEALRLYPSFPVAMVTLAAARQALGDHVGAIELAERARAQAPGSHRMALFLAETYARAGALEKATALFRYLVSVEPGIPELHYNLGRLLQQLGQVDEAEAALHRAIVLRPGYSSAHQALAAIHLQRGRPAEALDSYRRARRSDPANTAAIYGMAVASLALGDREGARTYAGEAAAAGVQIPEDFWRR